MCIRDRYKPSSGFAYATIGLLFVNISVGGTITHFAAPPVLMVAAPWDWGMAFMATHYGWKAALGILISNILYFMAFKGQFAQMGQQTEEEDGPKLKPRQMSHE